VDTGVVSAWQALTGSTSLQPEGHSGRHFAGTWPNLLTRGHMREARRARHTAAPRLCPSRMLGFCTLDEAFRLKKRRPVSSRQRRVGDLGNCMDYEIVSS
jgi:hypothetical protein